MSATQFVNYAPLRPPNVRDVMHLLDGAPTFLGVLASTGAVVDNTTTTNAFRNTTALGLSSTLAGRVLMFQPDAAGYLMPSAVALGQAGVVTLVAQANTVIAGGPANTTCGPLIQLQERVIIIMSPTTGFIQWLPNSGTANCYVWELV